MKKDTIILALIIFLFVGTLYTEFVSPKLREEKSNNQDTMDVVYSEEYTQSIRENVIRELYGSREQYASEQTGDRSNYVDKAASKNGELVIDEEKMQSVYDSKLREFDSKIDNAKVDEMVKTRQEQLVNEGAYNGVNDTTEYTSKKVMYWNNGGKFYAMLVELGMILFLLYRKRSHK